MLFDSNATPIIVGDETVYDLMTLSKEQLITLIKHQNEIIRLLPGIFCNNVKQDVRDISSNDGTVSKDTIYYILNKTRRHIENEYKG